MKCIITKIGQLVMEGDRLQPLTAIEGIVANAGNLLWNHQVGNLLTIHIVDVLGIIDRIRIEALDDDRAPPLQVLDDKVPLFQTRAGFEGQTADATNLLQ